MHFTLVFPGPEAHHESYGLVFIPSPVWVKGDMEIVNLHPDYPHYRVGDLDKLLDTVPVKRNGSGVVVVVHETGNGTEEDLVRLEEDLRQNGLRIQLVRIPYQSA